MPRITKITSTIRETYEARYSNTRYVMLNRYASSKDKQTYGDTLFEWLYVCMRQPDPVNFASFDAVYSLCARNHPDPLTNTLKQRAAMRKVGLHPTRVPQALTRALLKQDDIKLVIESGNSASFVPTFG